nr:unnamed protein product [Callosobruchus analis]
MELPQSLSGMLVIWATWKLEKTVSQM